MLPHFYPIRKCDLGQGATCGRIRLPARKFKPIPPSIGLVRCVSVGILCYLVRWFSTVLAGRADQISISASSRGIVDHFFCFICDEYKWDCDHLIEERLAAPKVQALEGSKLQCFAYDGQRRILEIEFRVGALLNSRQFHRARISDWPITICLAH